jgi:hypothetical protein
MKLDEVPKWAFDVESIKAPTKVVIDWEALIGLLLTQGWIVLEADDLILENNQSQMVKLLNNRVRGTYSRKFYTKRIGLNRWFCRLGENYKRKPR